MKEEKKPGSIDLLKELLPVPTRDPGAAARGKANFLKQASEMRAAETGKQKSRQKSIIGTIFPSLTGNRRTQVNKPLLAAVIILFILLGGSGVTVYAAQDSLPNAALYPLKTWSEDILVSFPGSPQSKIDYLMDFSDRRIDEMASLVISNQAIPEGVVIRLQDEMEQALELAASMDDAHMIQQNERIRLRAESQLSKVEALITSAALSEQPILLRARIRIEEQIRLCQLGQADPHVFRSLIQERQQDRNRLNEGETGNGNGPSAHTITPTPGGGGYGPGGGTGEQTPVGTARPTGGGNGPGPGTGNQTPAGTPQPTGGGTGPGPTNGEQTPAGTPQPTSGGNGPGQQDPSVTPAKNGNAP